ncbi:MAG TPA: transcription antitermination factor NusB [Chloroflexia bacterium]|nr:transcription antitermination factor NusB [Chloroflexia bacterium]
MSKLTSNTDNSDNNNRLINPAASVEEPDEWFELDSLQGGSNKPKNKLALERRQARGVALQTLFESDAVSHDPITVLQRHIETTGLNGEVAKFSRLLVHGVVENKSRLDQLISSAAPTWPMEQMAKVDKNILRLAIFEILFNNDVPTKAAINEAIELAKNFGSDSSSRFVNGVLGAIVAQNAAEPDHKQDEQPE